MTAAVILEAAAAAIAARPDLDELEQLRDVEAIAVVLVEAFDAENRSAFVHAMCALREALPREASHGC